MTNPMTNPATPPQTTAAVRKSTDFLVHQEEPLNGGPPAGTLTTPITPVERFFVRGHGPIPDVTPDAHRLRVTGRVERELELSAAELAARFPRVRVTATLQCAGLRRTELMELGPIPGELPWGAEALGTATWAGVRLADVLAAAGIESGLDSGFDSGLDSGAAHVAFAGLERVNRGEGGEVFGGSIPLAKALAPEVLLADEMNGEPLPAEHGGPLRVIVPGYIGARSVKWVTGLRVQDEPSDNHFQRSAYRMVRATPGTPPPTEPSGEMLGPAPVNSYIQQPTAGAVLPAAEAAAGVELRGWALPGGDGHPVARVEVSPDGGATWVAATLGEDHGPWAWRLWSARFRLPPGPATLVVRATDTTGATQPRELTKVWNAKGYANNAWHRVPVTVGG